MEPYWRSDDGRHTLYCGDCLAVLPLVGRVDAVVTSPPYASQRDGEYLGVPEADYPQFTSQWCRRVPLTGSGSLFINIREHVSEGQLSDYVHRTRMELREHFIECDELLWIKKDPMPTGDAKRHRRGWERILWFSNSRKQSVSSVGTGRKTDRIGLGGRCGAQYRRMGYDTTNRLTAGLSRGVDYLVCEVCHESIDHPAKWPVKVAAWLATYSNADLILDPFAGSGTTMVAAHRTGRRSIGIEIEPKYCEIAKRRMLRELSQPFLPGMEPHAEARQSELFQAAP